MQIEKRNRYDELMTLNGIDTLSGYVDGYINRNCFDLEYFDNVKKCSYFGDKDKTYIEINANKNADTENLITSFSQFEKKLQEIFASGGIDLDDFALTRFDFCFNSTSVESFELYQKLHRLLISCIALAEKCENNYVSHDLWSDERLSIRIQSSLIEVENYNKHLQSKGKDTCKNRLEIRSKKLKSTEIAEQLKVKWFDIFDRAINEFENVQKKYNDNLEQIYVSDLAKPQNERRFANLTGFLLAYKECIYTTSQMIDLLSRFEVKNPKNRAKRFKENHKIEYFSQTDLKILIKMLKKKIKIYLKN